MLRPVVWILAILLSPLVTFGQGKLDRVRDAVDPPREEKPEPDCEKSPKSCDSSHHDSSCSGDSLSRVFGQMVLEVCAAPWLGPHLILDPGMHVACGFHRYPYAAADSSYIVLDRPVADDANPIGFWTRDDTTGYAFRAGAEFGSDFNGLSRVSTQLFLDTSSRFGLKSDWDYYHERLTSGRSDGFVIADATATFRFVQHERVQMHTGLGGRFLLDRGHTRSGVNFLYGLDLFPLKPVHTFASIEAGTLGDATIYRLHGGAGALWKHGELLAGYDYFNIGGVALHGPFVGLRLWF